MKRIEERKAALRRPERGEPAGYSLGERPVRRGSLGVPLRYGKVG